MKISLSLAINARAVVPFDVDARIYFDAAGITDVTEKNAANVLVLQLKTDNIWDTFYSLYFASPTSLAAAAVNAKNPGTFDITWVNAPIHANTGVTGNGTTQYGRLGIVPSADMTLGNSCVTQYWRTNTQANITGVNQGVNQRLLFQNRNISNEMSTDHWDVTAGQGRIQTANLDSRGLGVSTRILDTDLRTFLAGVQLGATATTDASGDALPTIEFYIMAFNNGGVAATFSDAEFCFGSLGTGLTATQVTNLTNAVQTYQTNVISGGRQI